MSTDITEKGLETIIVESLINEASYEQGISNDFDRDHAVDLAKLIDFISKTQPKEAKALCISSDCPQRTQFLHRLQGEIEKRGVIDVLRNGVKHGAVSLEMFYGKPSQSNKKAQKLYNANIFSVTRQLHYSKDNTKLSLDVAIFINGLPVITFELKNRLTKQTVLDAVEQYKNDRDPRELLFHFGRCMVHFAVDEHEVRMCTHLKGKKSWFLPFNKGFNDGAGNPVNPNGIATDYLWKTYLTKDELVDIIENYAQIVDEKDEETKKKSYFQIFPRYHQLDVVRSLVANVSKNGVGKRYLIQHSAGSGKSNSIAWLAHQLVGLEKDGKSVFDSIIVITDRVQLDRQIRHTIRKFAQVTSIIGAVSEKGGKSKTKQLSKYLADGKKIITSTIQTFPFVMDSIGNEHRSGKYAIIIDEAHSSQGGRTAAQMNMALSSEPADDDETVEDIINKIMESRKMLTNASYFAFTATPKNKTLEVFGEPYTVGDKTKYRPFHTYTMKQAIQEGFILDVLKSYTTIRGYFLLAKTVEDDPEYDVKKAMKKLKKYVESHEHAITKKAEIMVDHFQANVLSHRKIGGKARAMIVTNSIKTAIKYYYAVTEYLKETKSRYKAIVAFSGEPEYEGVKVSESTLNGFPSGKIPKKFKKDPYRFLIVADKFQTGYDEPLLHTMYVDKTLAGIKAVQTLSRLNRSHPQKRDTFVLDFVNNVEVIRNSFADYYKTTLLSESTDPNKLHDLRATLDGFQVYNQEQVDKLVNLYIEGADRSQLEPILNTCVAIYNADLDEDGQVDFKGKAKAFTRAYEFLASILPYTNVDWEKLSIFLNLLIPKLPAPVEEDLSRGILEAIDMESYRNEVRATLDIDLDDQDMEIGPVPTNGGGRRPEPELESLSGIIETFNNLFGNIEWNDSDKIRSFIADEIPAKVAADKKYQNAIKNSDKQNARYEHDEALLRVMMGLLQSQTKDYQDQTELFKQYSDNPYFKKWLSDSIFNITYNPDFGQNDYKI